MTVINEIIYTIFNGSTYVGSDDSLMHNAINSENIDSVKDVKLESYIDGYIVLSIGKNAFSHSKIELIWIPKTVEILGYDSLAHCPLKTVIFEKESHLTTMDRGVFYSDTNFEVIYLPERLQSVGPYVFEKSSIKNVYYYGMFTIEGSYIFHHTFESYPEHLYVCSNAPFSYFGEFTKLDKVLDCPIRYFKVTNEINSNSNIYKITLRSLLFFCI